MSSGRMAGRSLEGATPPPNLTAILELASGFLLLKAKSGFVHSGERAYAKWLSNP